MHPGPVQRLCRHAGRSAFSSCAGTRLGLGRGRRGGGGGGLLLYGTCFLASALVSSLGACEGREGKERRRAGRTVQGKCFLSCFEQQKVFLLHKTAHLSKCRCITHTCKKRCRLLEYLRLFFPSGCFACRTALLLRSWESCPHGNEAGPVHRNGGAFHDPTSGDL